MIVRLIRSGRGDVLCRQLAERYQKRMKAWISLEISELRDDRQLLRMIKELRERSGARIVSLDERGSLWSSPELAGFIREQQNNPAVKYLCFVVGSPYGIESEVRSLCHASWSLSPAVFPSDLAWLLVNEQVYRAFSILHGSPYHHV